MLPTAFNGDGSPPTSANAGVHRDRDSDMGHLYYDDVALNLDEVGNTEPFQHLFRSSSESSIYWSGTTDPQISSLAWNFDFYHGGQQRGGKTATNEYAIAVRSGDVAAVPEPATIGLLGIGLVGLAGAEARRRRKKNAVDKS